MITYDYLIPGADSDYRNVRTCEPGKILLVENRCEKSGKHWMKSGNREILRRFIFFPVSAPEFYKQNVNYFYLEYAASTAGHK